MDKNGNNLLDVKELEPISDGGNGLNFNLDLYWSIQNMINTIRQQPEEFSQQIRDILALPEPQEHESWETLCSQKILSDHPLLLIRADMIILVYLFPYSSKPRRTGPREKEVTIENTCADCLRFTDQPSAKVGTFHSDISRLVRKTNTGYLEGLRLKFNEIKQKYSQICSIMDSKEKIEQLKHLQEQLATLRHEMVRLSLSRRKNKDIRESIRRTEAKLYDITANVETKVKTKRRREQLLITQFAPVRTENEHQEHPHRQGDQNEDYRGAGD